ncbi:hypothetical protein B296_00055443 [Ensete ventricosum]|uniref:Secreted protein n=1 Tax=Ensete ventricosum TaxID=4639 RepID=A0A426XLV0_ENSVE|nr:hypothetical protein B296_00055443 [Ensete ventricosum]
MQGITLSIMVSCWLVWTCLGCVLCQEKTWELGYCGHEMIADTFKISLFKRSHLQIVITTLALMSTCT